MVIQDPCGICKKPVANNHYAIKCDICDKWVHIKCNYVSKDSYNQYIDENLDQEIEEKDKSKWICIKCINSNLPLDHELDNLN